MTPLTVKVKQNGPYLIAIEEVENLRLVDHNGDPIALPEGPPGKGVALCRCGHSSHKPFCDATHKRIGFRGDSVASPPSPPSTPAPSAPAPVSTSAPGSASVGPAA